MTLTNEEVLALQRLISHQYIPNEDIELITLVRKIMAYTEPIKYSPVDEHGYTENE